MSVPSKVKLHIGPIAHTVLMVIAATGIIAVAVCAPNAMQILKPFFKEKKYSPKQAIQRNIESLIRSGLITYALDAKGAQTLELTRRGKWEVMLRKKFDTRQKKKWDGMWRVVIFDIPNEKEKLRHELRRGMRLYGFHLLQKSVWVYPYPCDDFVVLLREHLELFDGVIYLTVARIENNNELRKQFKL